MQVIYNTSNIKQMNLELIRSALKAAPGETKAGIAGATGLSHATCNNLLNELVRSGEVLELEKENKSGGRPTQRYQYNPNFFYILSLYIDNDSKRTVIRYAVFNPIGEIMEEVSLPKDFVDYQVIEEVVASVLQKYSGVKTIGIGIPGVVLQQRFVSTCDVEQLSNCPLADHLENRFSIKTVLENDMNATATGFYQEQGFGKDTSIAVMTFIKDNFPGSGIIVDGHILSGHTHFAGEIGYLPYNWTRRQMEEMLSESSTALPVIIKSVCSIIAVLNPEMIILTGSLIKENMLTEIQDQIGLLIAKEHIPHILIKENMHSFYLKGLMSVSTKTRTVSLI